MSNIYCVLDTLDTSDTHGPMDLYKDGRVIYAQDKIFWVIEFRDMVLQKHSNYFHLGAC